MGCCGDPPFCIQTHIHIGQSLPSRRPEKLLGTLEMSLSSPRPPASFTLPRPLALKALQGGALLEGLQERGLGKGKGECRGACAYCPAKVKDLE